MRSVPTTSIDLTDPDVVADPYPHFAREREQHAVAWHEAVGDVPDVRARDRRRRCSATGGWAGSGADKEPLDYLEPFNLLHRNQMMENEPPAHTRLRRPVAKAFARGHIERLRPRVREIAAELLAELDPDGLRRHRGVRRAAAGAGDRRPARRPALLRPRPARLVAGDRADVRGRAVPADGRRRRTARREDFAGLVRELVGERRAQPADDLITDLVATELTEDEVVAAVVLLLNAGHEASVNVFGNGLVAMLRRGLRPGADVPATVEEMLRFDSRAAALRAHRDGGRRGRRRHRRGRARRSPPCSARPTATPRSSTSRTSSGSTATPTTTWPSASACTSASALRWRGWSSPSRCPRCSRPSPT